MKNIFRILSFFLLIAGCGNNTTTLNLIEDVEVEKKTIVNPGIAICTALNESPDYIYTTMVTRDEYNQIISIKEVNKSLHRQPDGGLLEPDFSMYVVQRIEQSHYELFVGTFKDYLEIFNLDKPKADKMRLFSEYSYYYEFVDDKVYSVYASEIDYDAIKAVLGQRYYDAYISEKLDAKYLANDTYASDAERYIKTLTKHGETTCSEFK